MRNKIVDAYQSGKHYKVISKALGLQQNTVRAVIHKWRKLVTVVNLPMRGRPTKITPRAQWRLIQEVINELRTASKNVRWTAGLTCFNLGQCSWFNNKKKTGQKRHPWKSSEAKATADQKEHKSSSHICQKISWLSPRLLGKYSMDWWDKITIHVVPGRFGQLFSRNKWNHHFKTVFCIYVGYLCVILKLVWSESFKCAKYATKNIMKHFTALYVGYYHYYIF